MTKPRLIDLLHKFKHIGTRADRYWLHQLQCQVRQDLVKLLWQSGSIRILT